MELSKARIDELKKIFEQEYGRKLSDKEAWEIGHNLVNFFRVLLEIDQRTRRNLEKK